LKALVWFWLIDETLVLTYVIECDNELGWYNPRVELEDGHEDDGDDHKMIKCSL
jgi:hypothetical protein